jgi:hypothetical protein
MNSKLTVRAIVGTFLSLMLCNCQPAYAGGPAADPCSLLTEVQVSAVLGINVDPAKRFPSMCGWSAKQPNSSATKKVALLIINANAFGFAKTPIVSGESVAPASGICDDATYSFPTGNKSGSATVLFVKKGNTYFTVHVNGFPDQATAMKTEKALALDACSKL